MKRAYSIREKMVTVFLVILMIIECSFASFANNTERKIAQNSELLILTEEVPAEATEFAESIVYNQVLALYVAGEERGFTLSDHAIYIGNGYYAYEIKDGKIEKSTSIEYPVIQDDEIKCILTVYQVGEGWSCTLAKSYAEELQCLSGQGEGIFLYDEVGNLFFRTDTEHILISEASPDSQTNVQDIEDSLIETEAIVENISFERVQDINVNTVNILDDIQDINPNANEVTYVPGFSADEANYKVLQMANCFITQRDSSGVQRQMCWAATGATMIRYRIMDLSVLATTICALCGKGYDEGGSNSNVLYALNYYGIDYGYRALSRAAHSSSEVRHNINNKFPVYMGCGFYENGARTSGHAVTLFGFLEDSSGFTLMYWNSGTEEIESVLYKGQDDTYIKYNRKEYKWDYSTLIPY